ncbi:MAG: hypothetical protein F6K19_01405 [Cyanothece sp. SIO1E1]|nr:hypothetical protein [Cyanothece sp. SIO1E1]
MKSKESICSFFKDNEIKCYRDEVSVYAHVPYDKLKLFLDFFGEAIDELALQMETYHTVITTELIVFSMFRIILYYEIEFEMDLFPLVKIDDIIL